MRKFSLSALACAFVMGLIDAIMGKPAPAFANAGTRKIFYAWAVDRVNPGPGQDTTLVVGGYKRDGAVAAGSYPNPNTRITSLGAATSQCMAMVRRFQAAGDDCRGRTYYKIFGEDATDPVRALAASEDDEVEVGRIDVPERVVYKRVSLANREKGDDLGVGDNELPQDLDNPVGG